MSKPMPVFRELLLDRLSQMGVTMLTNVKYEEVTDKGLVITNKEGQSQTIQADTIVVTCGFKPNIQLLEPLKGKVSEIYLAGDCAEPCGILEAIRDGARIGHML